MCNEKIATGGSRLTLRQSYVAGFQGIDKNGASCLVPRSTRSVFFRLQAVSSVRAMHARGSGEAARRAKRGRVPLPSRAIKLARGHLRVSRFARRTTEKRETARSLFFFLFLIFLLTYIFFSVFSDDGTER